MCVCVFVCSNEELKKLADVTDTAGTVLLTDCVTELDVVRFTQCYPVSALRGCGVWCEQVKKMRVDRDNLIQDNEDQAAINLSHEPELQEGWTALQEKVADWLVGVRRTCMS